MKTNKKTSWFPSFIIIIVLSLLTCCSKQTPEKTAVSTDESQQTKTEERPTITQTPTSASSIQEDIPDAYVKDTFIEPENFFKLDYTPYLPDTEVARLNTTKGSGTYSATNSAEGSGSILSKLRPITEYQTDYSEKKSADTGKKSLIDFYKELPEGQEGTDLGLYYLSYLSE